MRRNALRSWIVRRPSRSVIAPPGLLDDDDRRGHVPRAEVGLDHASAAPSATSVAPEVAEPTIAPRLGISAPKPGRCRSCDIPRRAVEQLHVGDRTHLRDGDPPGASDPDGPRDAHAPPPRAAYQRSPRAGALTTPDLQLAVASDAEQRPEQRHAAHEVVRAVDRIEVPADAGVGVARPELLADDAVTGERVRDPSRSSSSIPRSAWVTKVRSGFVDDLEVAAEGARARSYRRCRPGRARMRASVSSSASPRRAGRPLGRRVVITRSCPNPLSVACSAPVVREIAALDRNELPVVRAAVEVEPEHAVVDAWRTSLFGSSSSNGRSAAPPVPATIWRMPVSGSGVPDGSTGANRS